MPHPAPLTSADPRRIGRYRLTGRLVGIPSDDPIYIGIGSDDAQVAITVLGGDWALDAAARDRFAAEASVARRVPPFCAARVLDAGLDGTTAYLVSEYVNGESLLEFISADGVRRGHDLEALAIGMATGLASIHQAGLVHGNFGPEFVIMAHDGAPRVVEFGITPPYGAATPSADMLAWAETVIFTATGHPPSSVDDLDLLPEDVRDTVTQCLDPEPGARPAARAVVQDLLGTDELPAGLLAEGSRRAIRSPHNGYRPGPVGQAGHVRPRYHDDTHGGRGYSAANRPAVARPYTREDDDADMWAAPRDTGPGQAVRHSQRDPSRGRLRSGWLVGVAAAALVAAGAVATHALLASGGSTTGGQLSADTGTTRKTASTGPSPSPTKPPITPAAFFGAWSGVVRQPPTDTYYVNVTFSAGTSAGTVSYAGTGFSCSGALTLNQVRSQQQLILSQGIIQGQSNCENGQVTITLTAPGKIMFSFHSNGPVAAGTLTRQAKA